MKNNLQILRSPGRVSLSQMGKLLYLHTKYSFKNIEMIEKSINFKHIVTRLYFYASKNGLFRKC